LPRPLIVLFFTSFFPFSEDPTPEVAFMQDRRGDLFNGHHGNVDRGNILILEKEFRQGDFLLALFQG
jgi:hypothetical protein